MLGQLLIFCGKHVTINVKGKIMRILRSLTVFIALLFTTLTAYAGRGQPADNDTLPCPDQAILNMDGEFGQGTSSLTSCIQNRSDVKNVFAWNLASVNKRSGFAQQVQVTRNTANNYESIYDMQINKDFKMVAVAYAGGGRWLLTDEAYNRTYGVTTGNPTGALTTSLIERGISVYMCQNTMRGNKWVTLDLLPGVKMVPSGAVAVLDYQKEGYKYINP